MGHRLFVDKVQIDVCRMCELRCFLLIICNLSTTNSPEKKNIQNNGNCCDDKNDMHNEFSNAN